MDNEKREACIDNLIQQIGWIEDIKAHQFPGWGHTVGAMRQAVALLKECCPRVMSLEEVKALQPDTDIWIEVRYLNAPIRIRACTVSGFSPGGTRLFIIGGAHNYPMDRYNNYFRCWTSRPTDTQREATGWNERSVQ